MIKWSLIAVVLVVVLPFTLAQVPQAPSDVDNVVLQKITQEHQNTRMFLSTELTRQRTEFYTQFDERAKFYEDEFFDSLDKTTYKLSLVWGGIVFAVIGLSNMLRITLERKRFRRMKETLKDELRAEIFLKNPPKPQAQAQPIFEQPHNDTMAYAFRPPQSIVQEKDGFFERRRKRKMAQEIEKVEREKARQEAKMAMLRAKIGAQPQYQQPVAPAQRQGLSSKDIARMTAEYNERLVREYLSRQGASQNIPAPPSIPKVEVY